jgi:hypothetical protein
MFDCALGVVAGMLDASLSIISISEYLAPSDSCKGNPIGDRGEQTYFHAAGAATGDHHLLSY